MVIIDGSYSASENAWVSQTLTLTGDCWLEVELPSKGHVVIKKQESNGKWPCALISPFSGPKFRIRIYGSTNGSKIRIFLTDTPKNIQYGNI
ncbi:MAG: hypothetical protein IJ588_08805 [Prevotella sp.]|nr:hypothetical protein [Prevotella sp.]